VVIDAVIEKKEFSKITYKTIMSKSPITCHGELLSHSRLGNLTCSTWSSVLDTSIGKPAEGIVVNLQQFEPAAKEGDFDTFTPIAKGYANL